VVDLVKSAGSSPLTEIEVMLSVALPVLVIVVTSGELDFSYGSFPNDKLAGLKVTLADPDPVPDKLTDCGVVGSESAIFIVALLDPALAGSNDTVTLQLPFPGICVPQLLVWLKSPALLPLKVKLVTAIVALLPFWMVRFWVLVLPTFTVPKLSDEGLRVNAVNPVPDRETVCGLPAALSATLTVAVREPIASGVNVTLIVQLDPCARELGQLFVCA
jgi:hypothetical protein